MVRIRRLAHGPEPKQNLGVADTEVRRQETGGRRQKNE